MTTTPAPQAPDIRARIQTALDLHRQGHLAEAESAYRQIFADGVATALVCSNLAAICIDQGRMADGTVFLERAIALKPDFVEAHFNLGTSLLKQGNLQGAVGAFRQAIAHTSSENRTYHWALYRMATILRDPQNFAAAVAAANQPAANDQKNHQAQLCITFVLKSVQGLADAATSAYEAIALKHRAHHLLALVHKLSGRLELALTELQHVVRLQPDSYFAYVDLGEVTRDLGRRKEAIAAFTRATELDERDPQAVLNLGYAYREENRYEDSAACFRKAFELRPMDSMVHVNLGMMYADQGRMDEAIASLRHAVELKRNNPTAHSSLIFHLALTQRVPQEQILAASRRFEAEACVKAMPPAQTRRIDRQRKTRLGFISAELGDHPVALFLEAYLQNYDRRKFELTLYSSKRRRESETGPLAALASATHELSDASDEEARRQILADDIDILIDTTSHTERGRLRLLSQRCAPIQCHYLGFFGTTGVSAIDYFIGDDEITPPEFAGHFSEQLIRLPRLWVAYTPPANMPLPEASSPSGDVTLGCFNNLIKVREETLTAWAAAMEAVPDARLIIKDAKCADPYNRQRIADFLGKLGVVRERITFLEKVPNWTEHMRLYNRIDIALDTTPLSSGTTGFDALYMATPLVSLRGPWMGARMSSSMLKALGRPEWIANSIGEFAQIVKELATDRPRLKAHKGTLRQEVLRSQLCDRKGLATALENAFIGMIDAHNAKFRSDMSGME